MAAPIVHTRIFVALTLAEAAAIARLTPGPDAEAVAAVAKIATALTGATSPPPLLRAKHYGAPPPPLALEPRTPKLRMASVDPRRRMAKAAIATPVSIDTARAPELDDYVPFRDEADGIYT